MIAYLSENDNLSRMAFFDRTQLARGTEIDDAVLTITEKDATRLERPIHRTGIWWLRAGFCCLLLLLLGRVFQLSVIDGEKYRERAEENSVRSIVLPAPRGRIFDRYGELLVRNIPSMELLAIPGGLPASIEERRSLLEKLREFIDFGADVPEDDFLSSDILSIPIVLKSALTQEESLLFSSRASEFPGITLERSAVREYTDSSIFAHIIGYEGKIKKEELKEHSDYLPIDSIGKQGIEKTYESFLRGKRGADRIEVDSRGMIKKELGAFDPKPGNDVILNIDARLQKKSFDILRSALESKSLTKGAVIAIDPRDGSVLALVSFPSFDNNLFARGIDASNYAALLNDPAKPLFNRAISGEYPPGSTIKPFIASAALSENIVRAGTQIESRGSISIGSFSFGDWKAHGFTDIRRAIAVSSDVYFYSVGGGYGNIRGLGMENINAYERRFGFGEKTGIDIPGEGDGFLPSPDWKKEKIGERWYIGDTYHASIGQGFVLATPLQIAVATAAVANGGTVWRPRIAGQVRSPDGGTQSLSPIALREAGIDHTILSTVREGMRLTITEGTAQSLSSLPIAVAGKTGTAQFGSDKKTHGWFSAFAPYENPSLVVLVLIEDQDETETYNAVPVSRAIYEWYFSEGRGKESLKN